MRLEAGDGAQFIECLPSMYQTVAANKQDLVAVIPALWEGRQGHQKLKVILAYLVS